MTTYHPPSTTIQLNNSSNPQIQNPAEAVQAPRPQSIAIVGDRKYLVVPKHSIVSVSPTIGAALNTPTVRANLSPTADQPPTNLLPDDNKSSEQPPPTSASLGPTEILDSVKDNTNLTDPVCDPNIPAISTAISDPIEQSVTEDVTAENPTDITKE